MGNSGYIKQWRKELDSDLWRKPPLYGRVWNWLKMSVDRHTGCIETSYQKIVIGVAWDERGVEKKPNKKTIKTILDWLVECESISVESNGSKTVITLLNWATYNNTENLKVTGNGKVTAESNGKVTAEDTGNTDTYDKLVDAQVTGKKRAKVTDTTNKEVQEVQEERIENLFSLSPETPTNRWLRVYDANTPGFVSPFHGKPQSEIPNIRYKIDAFISRVGEKQAIDALKNLFQSRNIPSTPLQAALYCERQLEAKAKERAGEASAHREVVFEY